MASATEVDREAALERPKTLDPHEAGATSGDGVEAPTPAPGDATRNDIAEAARVERLPQAVRLFYRYPSPWVLSAFALGFAVARLAVGGLGLWDLAIVAILVAWQPFQEWLIHVYLLHWRPREVLGVTLDLKLARRHRAHHVDPALLPMIFMPLDSAMFSLVVHAALVFWLLPTGLALTVLFGISTIGLVYEWTHFLIHTSYRPRSAFYRRIWRYHRLHHFKNEHFWFGVTMHQGDQVLGTLPDHKEVPTSPTARNLGAALGASGGMRA